MFAGTTSLVKVLHHLATVLGLCRRAAQVQCLGAFRKNKLQAKRTQTAESAVQFLWDYLGWTGGARPCALGLFGRLHREFPATAPRRCASAASSMSATRRPGCERVAFLNLNPFPAMCVVLICPPKQRPDLTILRACHAANPHGAGVAWRDKRRIHWRKALTPGEVNHLIQKVPGEVIIHFRWASVGGVEPLLCHPFPVTAEAALGYEGVCKSVLFHNGTWGNWESAQEIIGELDGPMSDSRAVAALVHHKGTKPLKRLPGRRAVMTSKEISLRARRRRRPRRGGGAPRPGDPGRGADHALRVRDARHVLLSAAAAARHRVDGGDRRARRRLAVRAAGAAPQAAAHDRVAGRCASSRSSPPSTRARTSARWCAGTRPHVDAVLVVDDGSTDDTAAAAEAAGAEVVRHPDNRGKGVAVRSGLAAVRGRGFTHVLLMDGDLQHRPADVPRLVAAAAGRARRGRRRDRRRAQLRPGADARRRATGRT